MISKNTPKSVETDGGYYDSTWRRPTIFYNHTVKYTFYIFVLIFIGWSIWEFRVGFDRLMLGIGAGYDMIATMIPPDYSGSNAPRIRDGIAESVAMAIVATVAGVAISIPVGFMASENLSPRPLYYVNRAVMILSRAFHGLIVAILFVKAFGFGPFAGIITLAFKTVGFYGKLLSEEIEEINQNTLDAVQSTGANKFQIYIFAVIPQVMPRIIGLSIYQWDINLRSSTIIGIVGAGGIGMTLIVSFQRYDYAFSSAIILVIIVLVIIGEIASQYFRNKVR